MREILFRGIREDNGKWLISDSVLHIDNSRVALWAKQGGWREVLPDTVGQYSGNRDKNSKQIFEGDIIVLYGHAQEAAPVIYEDLCFGIDSDLCALCAAEEKEIEVIGNIYDNPDLLEVKHDGDR